MIEASWTIEIDQENNLLVWLNKPQSTKGVVKCRVVVNWISFKTDEMSFRYE